MKKILIIFGTRPEFIKLAPLIIEAKKHKCDVIACSTGQHGDMLQTLYEFFKITPDYNLNLMKPNQTITDIVLGTIQGVRDIILKEKPTHIVVQGDTTSSFAAGLVGFFEKTKVIHVEAGLRTGDIHSPWPEELNRRGVALCADLHFPPTEQSKQNLLNEGTDQNKVFMAGNTCIDALMLGLKLVKDDPSKLKYNFDFPKDKKLILVTLHRRESFGEQMESLMETIKLLHKDERFQIVFPIHPNPNVRKSAQKVFGLPENFKTEFSYGNILFLNPLDYPDFITVMSKAYLILTDSGGVQEEAPALGVPILVARLSTERPESIESGNSILVGTDRELILSKIEELAAGGALYSQMSQKRFPYGDGKSCEYIMDTIDKNS